MSLLSKRLLINQFVPSTFCLCFAFTGINFRGMLHHVCDVAYDENMCGPELVNVRAQIDYLTLCKVAETMKVNNVSKNSIKLY